MILSGNEIRLQHEAGTIVIEPWDERRVNPNSYNVSLAPELMVYTEACLDPRQANRTRTVPIPEEGPVLHWQIGAVHPRYCRVWGCWLQRVLDP